MKEIKIELHFSQSKKPTQNSFVESCKVRFRDACLKFYWIKDLGDARDKINQLKKGIKEVEAHKSFKYIPYVLFA